MTDFLTIKIQLTLKSLLLGVLFTGSLAFDSHASSNKLCRAVNICLKQDMDQSCDNLTMLIKQGKLRLKANGVGDCSLNEEELAMITLYVGSGYGCINSSLRLSREKQEELSPLIETLNSALSKLPSYEGFVRRADNLPLKIRDLHQKGAIIPYPAFTSTSTGRGLIRNDQFIIFSKTGKPIMGFSGYAEESEVLFRTNTYFKVLDVRKTIQGKNEYIMKEHVLGESEDSPEEDERILKQAEKLSDEETFSWSCPLNSSSIPSTVKQP